MFHDVQRVSRMYFLEKVNTALQNLVGGSSCVPRVPYYDFWCFECKNVAYIADFHLWTIWSPPPRLIKGSETPIWLGLNSDCMSFCSLLVSGCLFSSHQSKFLGIANSQAYFCSCNKLLAKCCLSLSMYVCALFSMRIQYYFKTKHSFELKIKNRLPNLLYWGVIFWVLKLACSANQMLVALDICW